jgi:hypothetical protein
MRSPGEDSSAAAEYGRISRSTNMDNIKDMYFFKIIRPPVNSQGRHSFCLPWSAYYFYYTTGMKRIEPFICLHGPENNFGDDA